MLVAISANKKSVNARNHLNLQRLFIACYFKILFKTYFFLRLVVFCKTVFGKNQISSGFCHRYCKMVFDIFNLLNNQKKFSFPSEVKFVQWSLSEEQSHSTGKQLYSEADDLETCKTTEEC